MSCLATAWDRHEAEIRGFIAGRTGAPHLAEDLLQDVFVQAFSEGARLCGLENPRAWLFRVARNRLIDHRRGQRPVVAISDEVPAPAGDEV